ncbi:MAG: hypothetical protein JSU65_07080 [Candidatus Zixiibacteriota bacterium]|nr:MAG: hypothetical protein JSU65_07080 [candidate division Zixibacteria bacterium]
MTEIQSADSQSSYVIRLAAVLLFPPLVVWMDVFSHMLSGHPIFGEGFRAWHLRLPDSIQIGIRFGCPLLSVITGTVSFIRGQRSRVVRAIILCGVVFVILAIFAATRLT